MMMAAAFIACSHHAFAAKVYQQSAWCEINSPKDVQPYGESLFESLSIDWHSVYDEMPPEERLGAFTRHYGITLEAQANNYVTYFYRQHEYQGGIHGFTTEVGFTFRKSDGKQIALLADTDSPELA